jgi:histidinol-phosphate phosphatase family protein
MATDDSKTPAELKTLDLKKVDKEWTLFLDRDGVINEEIQGEYVLNWDQFIFSDGVLEALKELKNKFGRIIIITNQRGVGRKLMEETDLHDIHRQMLEQITTSGGNIDQIYYCIDDDDQCFNRKPNPGMAHQAILEFPEIDPTRTIMVGNKPSDMRFGRAAGTFTVFIASTNPSEPFPHPDIDLRFNTLLEFARAIEN